MSQQMFERGFTKVSNGLLEAIMHYPASGLKKDILLFLIRYTYGFQRNTVKVPIKEISENLKRPKNKICIALQELIRDRIVEVIRNHEASQKPRILSLNADSKQWIFSDRKLKNGQFTKRSTVYQKGCRNDDQKVNIAVYQKVNSYPVQTPVNKGRNAAPKKSLKKEKKKYSMNSVEFRLSFLLFNLLKERRENLSQPNMQQWCKHIDRLIRIDRQSPEEVERVIQWSQKHMFWQSKTISAEKLRKHYLSLAMQMGSEAEKNKSAGQNNSHVSESDRIRL
ncbi:MAG TPA: replication protein [Ignavibacteriales bacterium]|nr:replication protein [Ignavibacteriales bacterium]